MASHLDTVLEHGRPVRHGLRLQVGIAPSVLLVQHRRRQLPEETHQATRCAADLLVLEFTVCDQILQVE